MNIQCLTSNEALPPTLVLRQAGQYVSIDILCIIEVRFFVSSVVLKIPPFPSPSRQTFSASTTPPTHRPASHLPPVLFGGLHGTKVFAYIAVATAQRLDPFRARATPRRNLRTSPWASFTEQKFLRTLLRQRKDSGVTGNCRTGMTTNSKKQK
jgi:hypothetical protein